MAEKQLPISENCLIAIPFNRKPEEGELKAFMDAGADLFEVRLDLCGCKSALQAMSITKKFKEFPTIVTCRSAAEGGGEVSEDDRMRYFQQASDFATALDIELSSEDLFPKVANIASNAGCELIISYHNVESTPSKDVLLNFFNTAKKHKPQVIKIATMVNTLEEADRLVDIQQSNANPDLRLSVLAMGDNHIASEARIELAKKGAYFTFAANGDFTSAPGQPEIAALKRAIGEDDMTF